ncbi:MAG TPA: uracil-DNA glycosylase family protein [Acidobacteriaceae bacterium]|jgi:hypothetical protein
MNYGFFPGGDGLYDPLAARTGPLTTIILGSNFGCETGFIDDQGNLLITDERGNATWRPLLKRLRAAQIDPHECFFTNAWPFLHLGDGNLGPVESWLRDPALMSSCMAFFEQTVNLIGPKLIIALGTGPAAFLGNLWKERVAIWSKYSIDSLDELPLAIISLPSNPLVCVAITHPSMPNAWRRREPYKHEAGEIKLLIEARRKSLFALGS